MEEKSENQTKSDLRPKIPLPDKRVYVVPSLQGPEIIKDEGNMPSNRKLRLNEMSLKAVTQSLMYKEVDGTQFCSPHSGRIVALSEIRGITSPFHMNVGTSGSRQTVSEKRTQDQRARSSEVNNTGGVIDEGARWASLQKFLLYGVGLLIIAYSLKQKLGG